nr:MAG TPA: hypothetical protein [Crassvirales sp.]
MTEEQLSKMLKPLEWYEDGVYEEDKKANTALWYDFYLDYSMGIYAVLKLDLNYETYLVKDGIKTLEEAKRIAWEEYVKNVMSMFGQ